MRKFSHYFLILVVVSAALSGCRYQKLLKSTDYELKFQKAKEYFDDENYAKSLPLLEELMTIFRGTNRGEEVYYYYARAYFAEEDYVLSSYHLKNFVRTYPSSEHAEECLFLAALSYYLDSPKYSLDQSNSYLAIQEFQLFANQFPESQKVKETNEYIDKLRFKLETKAFQIAKLYLNTENYKSAITAFQNTLKDFPSTTYKEEILFLTLRSGFLLASNSIESKKQERYKNAESFYFKYADGYPQGKFKKEADAYYKKIKSSM
ncbi:MAG: outer membrane protein assembly factor BamD [Bacteroidia bacterium]|nr:outer membrane protein assembly factor BamD [Bacteroidia bacterium]